MARRLTEGEIALARTVFGDLIDYPRVRLGEGGLGGFAFVVGSRVTFPNGALAPDLSGCDLNTRAWLIHELTHVWQFQTVPLRTLASWARTAAAGGYGPGLPGYAYNLPLGPFSAYGLEQQASIVEHAYRLREGGAVPQPAVYADYQARTPLPGFCDTQQA